MEKSKLLEYRISSLEKRLDLIERVHSDLLHMFISSSKDTKDYDEQIPKPKHEKTVVNKAPVSSSKCAPSPDTECNSPALNFSRRTTIL